MKQKCNFKYTGAMVLGMHDALVELSGIIAGLTFAIETSRIIIMTGAIAAVAASLSMAAANYMAQRADGNRRNVYRDQCGFTAAFLYYWEQILGPGGDGRRGGGRCVVV